MQGNTIDLDKLNKLGNKLLESAEGDLEVFYKLINANNDNIRLGALFHLQQASEKVGKAFTIYFSILSCIMDAAFRRIISIGGECEVFKGIVTPIMSELCNLSDIAVMNPTEFGRKLGHNLNVINELNSKLYEYLKDANKGRMLINCIEKYLQKNLNITSNDRLGAVITQFMNSLKPTVENIPEPPKYNNYECVNKVVDIADNINNHMKESKSRFEKEVKVKLIKLKRSRMCIITNECKNKMINYMQVAINVLYFYILGSSLLVNAVPCLSLFEQSSRYCYAEGNCPPTDNKNYNQIAKLLKDIIKMGKKDAVRALNKIESLLTRLNYTQLNIKDEEILDRLLNEAVNEICIKECIKAIPSKR